MVSGSLLILNDAGTAVTAPNLWGKIDLQQKKKARANRYVLLGIIFFVNGILWHCIKYSKRTPV